MSSLHTLLLISPRPRLHQTIRRGQKSHLFFSKNKSCFLENFPDRAFFERFAELEVPTWMRPLVVSVWNEPFAHWEKGGCGSGGGMEDEDCDADADFVFGDG
ncbi:hypothetical protein SBOR_9570 [Sclerotinia borealis F-4128]|uniref:Uncharacterized protein n=1 Tax=Sclerotinia borealis (strain F-4128) TaxID=1432307 RepID=W9C2B8_SCLBF|nr:hypothetical protein SBOR_9570 [Sclerotinia borealis F-4128]